ncbi:MAG TPA: CRTAC1 family protein, partial [Thermoanaerobaculia bacterium]|nr:CRTAC1 family protein [Thermoanaerobaculia bacterium]
RAGLLGLAVNASGLRTGDMGVEVADFDGDLLPDLVSTHLGSEGMGFWTGSRNGGFRERAAKAGVVRATMGGTGFGIAVLDLENDGWPDLYLANGDIHRKLSDARRPDSGPRFEEPDRLLANRSGRFVEVSASTPAVFARSEVGRGVATGDLDNDGDLDLVLTNNGGPARVLLSRASELGPWTGVRLLDARGLEAVGSEATLFCADGRGLWRRSATDGSYASARDPRIHFGLGGCPDPVRLDVRWPDGTRERFDPPPPGEYHEIRQGSGQPDDAASGVS